MDEGLPAYSDVGAVGSADEVDNIVGVKHGEEWTDDRWHKNVIAPMEWHANELRKWLRDGAVWKREPQQQGGKAWFVFTVSCWGKTT